MQNHNFSSDFFINNIENINKEWFNQIKFFAKCSFKYYYKICNSFCDMLYKKLKLSVFSNFNLILILYSF